MGTTGTTNNCDRMTLHSMHKIVFLKLIFCCLLWLDGWSLVSLKPAN